MISIFLRNAVYNKSIIRYEAAGKPAARARTRRRARRGSPGPAPQHAESSSASRVRQSRSFAVQKKCGSRASTSLEVVKPFLPTQLRAEWTPTIYKTHRPPPIFANCTPRSPPTTRELFVEGGVKTSISRCRTLSAPPHLPPHTSSPSPHPPQHVSMGRAKHPGTCAARAPLMHKNTMLFVAFCVCGCRLAIRIWWEGRVLPEAAAAACVVRVCCRRRRRRDITMARVAAIQRDV